MSRKRTQWVANFGDQDKVGTTQNTKPADSHGDSCVLVLLFTKITNGTRVRPCEVRLLYY